MFRNPDRVRDPVVPQLAPPAERVDRRRGDQEALGDVARREQHPGREDVRRPKAGNKGGNKLRGIRRGSVRWVRVQLIARCSEFSWLRFSAARCGATSSFSQAEGRGSESRFPLHLKGRNFGRFLLRFRPFFFCPSPGATREASGRTPGRRSAFRAPRRRLVRSGVPSATSPHVWLPCGGTEHAKRLWPAPAERYGYPTQGGHVHIAGQPRIA